MPFAQVFRRFAAICLVVSVIAAQSPAYAAETADVVIAGERFELELALSPGERARGLMHRDSIDADGGMLFVFPDSHRRNFWMKNCLVDMDILFLDDAGRVTRIHEMFAEPPRGENESPAEYHARLKRYPSGPPARMAIELRHGTVERLGVTPGDSVELDVESLLPMAY